MISPNTTSSPKAPLEAIGDGRYVLGELLGRGGAGSVHRAVDTVLGVQRAVKILFQPGEALRERFLAEGRALARIQHSNVIRVYDYGETEDGTCWLVLDLAHGGSLAGRLAAGPVPLRQTLEILFEVLSGLEAIHAAGFVHRDIKPGNILFSVGGTAWVSDLGVLGGADLLVERAYRTTGVVGTVGYTAPEIRISAQFCSAQSDVYAAGATLYAALTARMPADLSVLDLAPKVLTPIPEEARSILVRATHRDLDQRYQDARSMAIDVAEALDKVGADFGEAPAAASRMAAFDERVRRARETMPPVAPRSSTLSPAAVRRASEPGPDDSFVPTGPVRSERTDQPLSASPSKARRSDATMMWVAAGLIAVLAAIAGILVLTG